MLKDKTPVNQVKDKLIGERSAEEIADEAFQKEREGNMNFWTMDVTDQEIKYWKEVWLKGYKAAKVSPEGITLQQAKDIVAKKHHWDDWVSIRHTGMDEGMFEVLTDEAAELYASQFKAKEDSLPEATEQWIPVDERLPERVPNTTYSQVQCLVNKRYEWTRGDKSGVFYQVQILTFNHEHECWDQEDGDDHDCDINQVTHWMPLPSPPRKPE